jgi:hypothetical protein
MPAGKPQRARFGASSAHAGGTPLASAECRGGGKHGADGSVHAQLGTRTVDMVAGGAGGAVDGLPGRHRVRRPLRRNKK